MESKVPEKVPCPYCGKPMRLVGRTATHARYICTGPTCRQTYEKPSPRTYFLAVLDPSGPPDYALATVRPVRPGSRDPTVGRRMRPWRF